VGDQELPDQRGVGPPGETEMPRAVDDPKRHRARLVEGADARSPGADEGTVDVEEDQPDHERVAPVLVAVRPAGGAMTPATAATPAGASTRRGFGSDVAARGREDGKLLGEARRTAVRAGRALPVAGAHQHFAFLPARLTLELVDRHGGIVAGGAGKLNRLREGVTRRFGENSTCDGLIFDPDHFLDSPCSFVEEVTLGVEKAFLAVPQ